MSNKAQTLYDSFSEKRKQAQADGIYPEWYTTGGYIMFEQKYRYESNGFRGQIERIAKTAAKHAHRLYGDEFDWEAEFFKLFWEGDLSASTPVLANMGTTRAYPVSCSGQYIDDSVDSFYENLHETAMLSKMGFGTSGYLGAIRPRGTPITGGGKAAGVGPVLDDYVTASRKISQGGTRRGAWAGYIEPEHPDFDEVLHYLKENVDDTNIGWCLTDELQAALNGWDNSKISEERAEYLWGEIGATKGTFGKGYYFFKSKANRARPEWYKKLGLEIEATNLCSEIMLHSSRDYTYTCVLSSMNMVHWDRIKTGRQVFFATVFLDCVAEEFIQLAKGQPGMEKAVAFTEKGRALGLGQCGFHTYLQQNMIPFESFDAHVLTVQMAEHIMKQAVEASEYMAAKAGEPEWMKGYGRRNTHLIAIAPTKSTALLMGGVSEGINPDPAMTYVQTTAAGEMDRVNPTFLAWMKANGVYSKRHVQEIVDAFGSVQNLKWVPDAVKEVFKTAFEIDQRAILRLASARQKHGVDQGQSLNLFFSADEKEEYISEIMQEAWEDPYILALYYNYSQAGIAASSDKVECESCQ